MEIDKSRNVVHELTLLMRILEKSMISMEKSNSVDLESEREYVSKLLNGFIDRSYIYSHSFHFNPSVAGVLQEQVEKRMTGQTGIEDIKELYEMFRKTKENYSTERPFTESPRWF